MFIGRYDVPLGANDVVYLFLCPLDYGGVVHRSYEKPQDPGCSVVRSGFERGPGSYWETSIRTPGSKRSFLTKRHRALVEADRFLVLPEPCNETFYLLSRIQSRLYLS